MTQTEKRQAATELGRIAPSVMRLEEIDDVANRIRRSSERFNDLMTIKNLCVGEEYIKGRLGIGFELKPRAAHGHDVYVTISTNIEFSNNKYRRAIRSGDSDISERDHRDRGDQQEVLIHVVQFGKAPNEKITGPPSAISLVRLDRLNEVADFIRRSAEFTRYAAIQIGFGFVDGESGPASAFPARVLDQPTSEVIQRSSEIVDCIAYDGRGNWRQGLIENAPNLQSGSIGVFMNLNSVWVIADERVKQGFEIGNVALCPLDL